MIEIEKPQLPFNCVKFEREDGREGEILQVKAGRIFLTSDQKLIGEEMLNLLNRSIHHDGSWRCVWCDPVEKFWNAPTSMFLTNIPDRFEMHYLDGDRDPIFKVDCTDKPWIMIDTGLTYYRDSCEEAYQTVKDFNENVLELSPNQTFKQAKGEKLDHAFVDAPDISII